MEEIGVAERMRLGGMVLGVVIFVGWWLVVVGRAVVEAFGGLSMLEVLAVVGGVVVGFPVVCFVVGTIFKVVGYWLGG